MKLLSSRPALWFLFLFNLTVALVVGIGGHRLHIHGHTLRTSEQVMTSIGMAVVALGAGAGLLRRRRARPDAYARPAGTLLQRQATERYDRDSHA